MNKNHEKIFALLTKLSFGKCTAIFDPNLGHYIDFKSKTKVSVLIENSIFHSGPKIQFICLFSGQNFEKCKLLG